jgi:hypothetical protein
LLWKLDICTHKLKLDPCLSPCTSINLKWIKDHNKTWNSESSARKIRNYNGTNRHRKWLSKKNCNGSATRERIDKWGYVKLKCFWTTKEIYTHWMRRPPTEWGKSLPAIHQTGINTENILKHWTPIKSMTQWRNTQMNWTELFQRQKSKWPKTT